MNKILIILAVICVVVVGWGIESEISYRNSEQAKVNAYMEKVMGDWIEISDSEHIELMNWAKRYNKR